jgi:hypothetical protein
MEAAWIIPTIGLIFTAISVWFVGRQISLDRKIRTLDYVTNQFDRLAQLGAREELRAMEEQDILTYTAGDHRKTQKLLEYVYTFNRIGAGIRKGALSEDVIFNIWTPKWFEGHWKRFEPLIIQEKTRRGEEASDAYRFFEWLAKEKCPKVRGKYPQYRGI